LYHLIAYFTSKRHKCTAQMVLKAAVLTDNSPCWDS